MNDKLVKGEIALKRIGEMASTVCELADGKNFDDKTNALLEVLIEEMGAAIRNRDVDSAKSLIVSLLSDILGYRKDRAKFLLYNHLHKKSRFEIDERE